MSWPQLSLLDSPAPTSLTAGAHEARRTDTFTNMVMADAAVQTVGTVLLAGRSPFLCGTGCRESGRGSGWHQAPGYGCLSPRAMEPGPCSPLTIRR